MTKETLMDQVTDKDRVPMVLHTDGNYYLNAQAVCDVVREHEKMLAEIKTIVDAAHHYILVGGKDHGIPHVHALDKAKSLLTVT